MNVANYISHAIYRPDTYARRFDVDVDWLPKKGEGEEKEAGMLQRVLVAALPFIALYRPAGQLLSWVSGGSRIVTHAFGAMKEEGERNWGKTALEVGKLALAILALSATFFHFTTGLLVVTGADVLQGIHELAVAISEGEIAQGLEAILQAIASSAYLAFMIGGALEAMALFSLLQAIVALYQSRGEIEKGHYIEAAAKVAMGCLKIHATTQYLEQIDRRDALMKQAAAASLFAKIARGRGGAHLIHHPLSSLQERIEANDLVFRGADGEEIHLGAAFHGEGGALVKGENLSFRTRSIDGEEFIELEFKVNHAFRENLQREIDDLKRLNPKMAREIFQLAGSHASGYSIRSGSLLPEGLFYYDAIGAAQEVEVDGLGTLLIGSDREQPTLYDKVVVRMRSDQTLYSLHELLCFVNLSDALCLSTPEDIERLKMGHLFRTFFPKEAFSLERGEEFFKLPLAALKEKMFALAPASRGVFERYYHRMRPEAILGGKIRYRIEGLAEEAYQRGARALTAALTGAYSEEELFARAASMLEMGMLSSEVRHASGMTQNGLSFGTDYFTGGADSVFTQLLTANGCKEHLPLHVLYHSKVRFLISLEALELGSYQYHGDNFGHRLSGADNGWFEESYDQRDGILTFIDREQQSFERRNEVMLKEHLPPSFFQGIVVSDEQTRTGLIRYLEAKGLVHGGFWNETPIERFIRVGTHLSEELLSV